MLSLVSFAVLSIEYDWKCEFYSQLTRFLCVLRCVSVSVIVFVLDYDSYELCVDQLLLFSFSIYLFQLAATHSCSTNSHPHKWNEYAHSCKTNHQHGVVWFYFYLERATLKPYFSRLNTHLSITIWQWCALASHTVLMWYLYLHSTKRHTDKHDRLFTIRTV